MLKPFQTGFYGLVIESLCRIVTMSSTAGPARPPSPTSSFYALSDDEEGEYNTITHTSTGRGVKLLYSKSKVRFLSSLCISNARQKLTPLQRFTSIQRHLQRTTYQVTLHSSNRNLLLPTTGLRLPPLQLQTRKPKQPPRCS